MTSATTATAAWAGVTQHRKQNRRRFPWRFDVNFLGRDPGCGSFQALMARAAIAAVTIAVPRYLETESHGAEVSHFAEEFYRRLGVVVLEFALRGAHAAQALNIAGHALGGTQTLFSQPGLREKLFPSVPHAAFADIEGLLLGEDADAHFAVRIDGKRGLAAAAKIERIVGFESGWIGQVTLGQVAVFVAISLRVQIKSDDVFWQETHG